VLTLLLMAVLWRSNTPGFTSGFYLVASGLFRFINEFFRADPRGAIGFLSTSQFISLLIIGLGILFMLKIPQWVYEKHLKN
jgi:phosphatidylglycerol:prolipoprotein diacylglycerol transferase